MATWHQEQAIRRSKGAFHYWHETKWVLLSNPPGVMSSSVLFDTKEAAEKCKALWESNGRRHLLILEPASVVR